MINILKKSVKAMAEEDPSTFVTHRSSLSAYALASPREGEDEPDHHYTSACKLFLVEKELVSHNLGKQRPTHIQAMGIKRGSIHAQKSQLHQTRANDQAMYSHSLHDIAGATSHSASITLDHVLYLPAG